MRRPVMAGNRLAQANSEINKHCTILLFLFKMVACFDSKNSEELRFGANDCSLKVTIQYTIYLGSIFMGASYFNSHGLTNFMNRLLD